MNHDHSLLADPLPPQLSKLDDVVKHHVLSVYQSCAGDKRKASSHLGISLPALYKLFDGWGVLSDEFRREWRDHVGRPDLCAS